ncbi:MAG: sigma 54-interacting transcriptional regulator, partial [Gammaproteobacteria bacterium]|nr:sigma 54-interacting transcriptional regulator [Gammaproteobacteria bacterium]
MRKAEVAPGMIWQSTLAMTIIDVFVIAVVGALLVILARSRVVRPRIQPTGALHLITATAVTVGLFHLADLVAMLVLPSFIGQAAAMEVMTFLHLEMWWYVTIVVIACICVGLVLARRRIMDYEDALRTEEIRYRAIVENQTEFIVRWQPGGIRTWVNDRYCDYFGQTRDELVGTSFFPLVDDADSSRVRAEIASLSPEAPTRTGEHQVILPSGETRWHEWTDCALFDDDGKLIEIQSVGRDITDRKRAQDALARSEAWMRDLVEKTSDWVWEIGADLRYVYSNPQIEKILGYTKDEICRTGPSELLHPDDLDSAQQRFHECIAEKSGWTSSVVRFRHRNGNYRYIESSAAPVIDRKGNVSGFRGVDRDVTFTTLMTRLSQDLLRAQGETINERIAAWLGEIGEIYLVDQISLWWLDAPSEMARRSHRWTKHEPAPKINETTDLNEFPWIKSRLLAGETIVVASLDDIPADEGRDRGFLAQQNISAALGIPLQVDDALVGFGTFCAVDGEREWPASIVSELTLLSNTLASAYHRTKTMQKLRERERELASHQSELRQALESVSELTEQLKQENVYLRGEVRLAHGHDKIVGNDPKLKKVLADVEKVAPTDVPVLILGETGTGKELIANAVHELSDRADRPLVSVNCAALSPSLIESELFGHEKGAFTGAHRPRKGRFELAHRGTLFLDEIGDLPMELQAKLLRVLQSGSFERLGGTETLTVDVRLVAATNRDLRAAIDAGKFRADLYYRISGFPIEIPPLRERRDDIPMLAEHFVRKHAARHGRNVDRISARSLRWLSEQQWPGNVRELEAFIERSLISMTGNVFDLAGPDPVTRPNQPAKLREESSLRTAEKRHIEQVLEATKWTISGKGGAASILGIPPSTLRSKM